MIPAPTAQSSPTRAHPVTPYHKLPKAPLYSGRQQALVEHCRGKRVLHVGCVDAGYLEERFEAGALLHQQLAPVCTELWGLDIDEQGLEFLRKEGFDHLLHLDVSAPDAVFPDPLPEVDVVLASEVLEHVINPGLFLRGLRRFMRPGGTQLILTVPNAFRVETLYYMTKGIEFVHPDHKYWFSCVTVRNVLAETGFAVVSLAAYSFQSTTIVPAKSSTPPGSNGSGPSLARKLLGVPFRVPELLKRYTGRLIVRYLYGKTAFWGDGLIVVAETAPEK